MPWNVCKRKIAQVDPGQCTRDTAAEKAGVGNHKPSAPTFLTG